MDDNGEVTIYQTEVDETGFVVRTPVVINLEEERQKFIVANKDLMISQTDEYILSAAKSMGYSTADSACVYAGARNRFQLQSTQFVIFRGACWDFLYNSMDAMLTGTMPVPSSTAELLAMLPKFEDFAEAAEADIAARYKP